MKDGFDYHQGIFFSFYKVCKAHHSGLVSVRLFNFIEYLILKLHNCLNRKKTLQSWSFPLSQKIAANSFLFASIAQSNTFERLLS